MFSFAWPGRVNQEIWYACYIEGHNNTSEIHRTSEHARIQKQNTRKVDIVIILFSKDAVCYASYLCGRMDVSKAILSFYLLFFS